MAVRRQIAALVAAATCASACSKACSDDAAPVSQRYDEVSGSGQVWVVDDGERIAGDLGATPLMQGQPDGVWQQGKPIRLFGLPGETIAFQLVVSAGSSALDDVHVELSSLRGPSGDLAAKHSTRFLLFDLPMKRRSGGKTAGESLGWEPQATPAGPAPGGVLPDPLIPVDLAPPWFAYPFAVPAGRHRVVWIEISPPEDWKGGHYGGSVEVRASGLKQSIELDLELGSHRLPYAAAPTMLYFDPDEITGRVGGQKALFEHLKLVHQHHLTSVFPIRNMDEAKALLPALTGKLYTPEHGYAGPGVGRPEQVVILGAYGSLRDPTPEQVSKAAAIAKLLDEAGVKDEPGKRDIFLYAVDEQCDSPRGRVWRKALDASGDPLLTSLRVGHTCTEPPQHQAVDLVMMFSAGYTPEHARAGRAANKHVWIYNGVLPMTGSFLTDAPPLSLRANPWIQRRYGIERWFYWEATFWNDSNRGGLGPYDPFAGAETFHNQHGDFCNGDGVLVYPGKQKQFPAHDLGHAGTLPSFRLKQWRRGIQDVGYLQLAHTKDAKRTQAILERMVPKALGEVKGNEAPAWPTAGIEWLKARRELFAIIEGK